MIDNERGLLRDSAGFVNIKFQVGNPDIVGINGSSVEEVSSLLVDRLELFQESGMHDGYTNHAIVELEKVISILNDRMLDRMDRGIYGTHQT